MLRGAGPEDRVSCGPHQNIRESDSWFTAFPQDTSWVRDWKGVELEVPCCSGEGQWQDGLGWLRRTLIDGGSSRLTRQSILWMGPHLQTASRCWCLGFVGPQEMVSAGRTGTVDQTKCSCFFGSSVFHYK